MTAVERAEERALTIDCPLCLRRAGFPCEDVQATWVQPGPGVDDPVRGGLVGPDEAHPHDDRVRAAARRDWPY